MDFLTRVGASEYWREVVSEYGVGPASATSAVVLTQTATGSETWDKIGTWLAGELNADNPQLPAADENTLYALHYPSAFEFTEDDGSECDPFHSWVDFDENHQAMTVAFSVVGGCGTEDGYTGSDPTNSLKPRPIHMGPATALPMRRTNTGSCLAAAN